MKLSKAALQQRKEFNFTPCPKPKRVKKIKKTTRKKLMSMKRLEQVTWTIMSQYIRLRDSVKCGSIGRDWLKCYTCGKDLLIKDAEASHFIPRGKHIFKFNEKNIKSCCVTCNHFLHGNLGMFAVNLDLEYGHGTAKYFLDHQNDYHKFSRQELEDIRKDCALKISILI